LSAKNDLKAEKIFLRIISMLVNEAADTVHYGICSEADVEMAVQLGLNFPKGLLQWGREIGYDVIIAQLLSLNETYREERYRVSPFLNKMAGLQL
jgi:3-hydroxybutyryl-CoA dehydrogenase